VLAVAARVLAPFQSTLAGTFARQVNRHLQERVMAAVGRPAGIAHLEDAQMLDLIKNAQGVGTEGLQPGHAVMALATLLPSWAQALGAAGVLLAFSPLLGAAWLVLWPVVLAFLMREFIRVGQAAMGQAAAVRRSDYYRDLALTPGPAKELRIWGVLDWLVERFDASWSAAMLPVWRARNPGRPVVSLSALAVSAVNFGSYALLVSAALRGDLTLAALAVYVRAVQEASGFRAFDDPNAHLAYAAVSVPALLALERRVAALDPPPGLRPLPASVPHEAIRFERVTFRYPGEFRHAGERMPEEGRTLGQLRDVLSQLDLEIPAGKSLAIVGANGAGKTTLVKLLCALYAPTAGRVTVDGHDLAGADPRDWQRRVAAIFQDFVQYELSVRDNVALGAPEAACDEARLRIAAERAGALELIESLPHGWETILSRRYTSGTDLSGGQWQRIALARALFAAASGARVLILDEPTAALDVRAEAALYDRFLEITAGLTTIVISHRFSTVRRADRIVVLHDGGVAEQGSHDDLVAAGGLYAHMFSLQAARFADSPPAATEAEAHGVREVQRAR
jgi:ABC-type multidrug transport system fused ATPase/permease subunit